MLLPLTPARPDGGGVLAGLVGAALRKAPGIGPQAPKVAKAAVQRPDAREVLGDQGRGVGRLGRRPLAAVEVQPVLAEGAGWAPSETRGD
ncbi:hypothetical protein VM98_37500, partial [Streptomyces rubellomurinus subsp. indigoferus]